LLEIEVRSHHRIQTDSGALPASYPMGNADTFLEFKTSELWSWTLTSIWFRG